MKHHSILTTLFPRLPFARRSMADLLSDRAGNGSAVASFAALPSLGSAFPDSGGEESVGSIYVSDLIPSVEIGGRMFHCDLSYEELPESHPIIAEAGTRAVVQNRIHFKDASGDEVPLAAPKLYEPIDPNSEDALGLIFTRFWDALREPRVARIDVVMTIFVAKEDCPGYAADGGNNGAEERMRAALRREHVAREFTTGYRRYISLLLCMLSAGAYQAHHAPPGRPIPEVLKGIGNSCHVVQKPATHQSDLHSTTEDAWRLLCTFRTIEKAAKRVNLKVATARSDGWFVLSLQDFVDSLASQEEQHVGNQTAEDILLDLYRERNIGLDIALRKTLEYYIFEELSSMPRA